jgi:hypothetical protein
MSQSRNTDRPTQAIVIAGEILCTLHPSLLGALLVVYKDDSVTQAEVAEAVGRTQPTVSSYFQSLENLPVPLTIKRGQRNTVTDTGEKVISLIRRLSTHLDVDLSAADWSDESDREAVSTILSPLHDSRSTEPFFILDSLYGRSDIDGLLGTPQPVWLDDVVNDVKQRQQERDKSTTLNQIREKVKRFRDTDVLTFDGTQITLTEKGQEHARLLIELVQFLTDHDNIDLATSENIESQTTTEADGESQDNDESSRSESIDTVRPVLAQDDIVQQQQGQRFLGERESSDVDRILLGETPTVVLTYCLQPSKTSSDSKSQPSPVPVVSLTPLTAGELADHVEQVVQEYGGDTPLIPYWALQTETGLYPLGKAGIPPTSAPEFENGR